MSFSGDVKKELSSIPLNDCCLKAELYSAIRIRADISFGTEGADISFSTTQIAAARRIVFLLRKLYDVKVDLKIKKKTGPTRNHITVLTLPIKTCRYLRI